jgi:hypothetical protein
MRHRRFIVVCFVLKDTQQKVRHPHVETEISSQGTLDERCIIAIPTGLGKGERWSAKGKDKFRNDS